MKRQLLIGVAVTAMVLPQAVFAQEAPARTDAGTIEDIVVTAQRRSESAQKAAIAISVVTSQQLEQAGVVTANTLNAVAPSLATAQGGASTQSYFVRGVGNFSFNAYSDPAVAFNYDGVYIGRPTSTGTTFFDIERVEVLKGPQGTLYGRNATGGAINVLPAKPRLGENSASVSAGFGNYSAWDAGFAANMVVDSNSALRIAGKIIRQDGFSQDGTNDQHGEALRAQFLTQFTNGNLRLAFDYSHLGGMGTGASFNGALHFNPTAQATATAPAFYTYVPANLAPRSGLLSPAARTYFAGQVIGGAFNLPQPFDTTPSLNDKHWGISGELNLDTDVGKLTVLPAYRESSLDDTMNGPSFRGGIVDDKDKQFSIEARLAGKQIGPVEWLAGAYYYKESVKGAAAYNQYVVESIQTYDVSTKSLAGFGRLTVHLADAFRLVAGGRYTHDEKAMNGLGANLLNICTTPLPAGPGCFGGPSLPTGITLGAVAAAIPAGQLPIGFPSAPGATVPFGANGNIIFYSLAPVNKKVKTNRFTYRLAAEYDVAANSLAYVSYETGYRSGGFALTPGREVYNPEYIYAFTAGIKNRFFNNRVQLNLEAFHWKYKDQQVTHFGINGIGQSDFFTENIGNSTIKGFDVDAIVKVGPLTTLNATIQYLDNKLDSFVYQVTLPSGLPPAVGCPITPGVGGFRVDCSGKPGYNSPKWSLNMGFEQLFELGPDMNITFSTQGRYRSNRVIGFDYLAQQNSGSDFTADASLSLGAADDKWSITAWVNNLGNTLAPAVAQFNPSVGETISTIYAPPRTYGLRGSFRF